MAWHGHRKPLLLVQTTGDAEGNAFINVYQIRKQPTILKSKNVPRFRIEAQWQQYNYALERWYTATTHRKKLRSVFFEVENNLREYCERHANTLNRISRHDLNPRHRGIANAFLSLIETKNSNQTLLRNATNDPDHFAHNMAWQSLLVKLDSGRLSQKIIRLMTRAAIILLRHPSAICRNKGLLAINSFLKQGTLTKRQILRDVANDILRAAGSPNPIINNPARRIKKALGKVSALSRDRNRRTTVEL